MNHPPGSCPVCHKAFTGADDIVTCPSCGAPYHRACYQEVGYCIFEDRHADGFEYKTEPEPEQAPPQPEAAAGQQGGWQQGAPQNTGGILCRSCGTVNDAAHIFCENCGAALHSEYSSNARRPGQGAPPPGWQQGYSYAGPAVDMTGEIDGIGKTEWAAFVGPSAPAYLARLSQQQTRKSKLSFMFSPFFLGTFYFAYRKMWGWTVAAAVSYLVCVLPNFLWILADGGWPPLASVNVDALYTLSVLFSYVSLARQVLMGIFSLYLFRQHAVKKMKYLREHFTTEAEYMQVLASEGGTSVVGPVVVVILLFVFSYILSMMAGDIIVQYAYSVLGMF